MDVEPELVVVKHILPYVAKNTFESPVNDEIEILRRIEELRQINTTAEGPKFLADVLFHSLDLEKFAILLDT